MSASRHTDTNAFRVDMKRVLAPDGFVAEAGLGTRVPSGKGPPRIPRLLGSSIRRDRGRDEPRPRTMALPRRFVDPEHWSRSAHRRAPTLDAVTPASPLLTRLASHPA